MNHSKVFRWLLDSCIWMAYSFGPLPAEILLQRDEAQRDEAQLDEAGPPPGETLSRAERRQWESLVRQLR